MRRVFFFVLRTQKKPKAGRDRRHQLSAPPSTDDASAAETLGVAIGEEEERVAWQRKSARDVLVQRGHQDSLRRAKTKTYCEKEERPRSSRMDCNGHVTCHGRCGTSNDLRKCCFLQDVSPKEASKLLGFRSIMAMQILWGVEPEWKKKKMGLHLDTWQGGSHHSCSFIRADNCSILSHTHLKQMLDLFEEAEKWHLNQQVCGGQAPMLTKKGKT